MKECQEICEKSVGKEIRKSPSKTCVAWKMYTEWLIRKGEKKNVGAQAVGQARHVTQNGTFSSLTPKKILKVSKIIHFSFLP